MLRPVRIVRATTKEELDCSATIRTRVFDCRATLDAALDTADQITVEGDDELLSYAVNKAASDPESHVSVEIDDLATTNVGGLPVRGQPSAVGNDMAAPPPAATAG